MYHDFTYQTTLASSLRGAWELDDVLREDQELDFTSHFMPEGLARTAELTSLTADEQRYLNQIAAHEYLGIFGIVEEFILPFLFDHARPALSGDDWRVRAIINFASEEAKHIHLFKRFHQAFKRSFPVECQMIGPSEAIGAKVLSHDPLAIALIILMIEWMTQQHYLGSIRDDRRIDPLFKSLLKHHWIEEAQHAKLDTLIVEALAEGRSEDDVDQVMNEFFEIGSFLDDGLLAQANMNLDALEALTGRPLPDREEILKHQHQAGRWTFIGSGLVHERFRATVAKISPRAAARVDFAAPHFC